MGVSQSANAAFSITPAAAWGLSFVTQPTATMATGILNNLTVQIVDRYGNAVAQQGSSIALGLASGAPFFYDYNDGNGSNAMPSANLVSDGNGQATFSTLQEHRTGTYSLKASDAADGFAGATSKFFAITSGAAVSMAFTTQPAASGQFLNSTLAASTGNVIVQLYDQFGNIAKQSNVPITITISDFFGNPYGTATVKATNSSGQALFNLKLFAAGTFELTATSNPVTIASGYAFSSIVSNSIVVTQALRRWY